ncbi:MAG TPA: hypothetical protein VF915_10740, partial [Reyranella sp.]
GSLPLPAVELLVHGTLDGKPVRSRGPAFAKLVHALHAKGHSFGAVLATLAAYPNGVQSKFAGRLDTELRRILDKIESGKTGLPEIQVIAGKRHAAADAGIAALIAGGVPIYQRNAELTYVIRLPAKAADGRTVLVPGIKEVPSPLLLRELGKAAVWRKFDGRSQGLVPIDPPSEVAAQIRAMADEWPFPPLLGVISTPTLRPDGSLLDRPGYDPATGLVLFEPPPMPPIPAEPSKDEALLALKVIDALLAEFPYSDDKAASRSVALSMLMTPVLRGAIGPAVPLHIAKAPAGGTGKSYLADIASGIAVGEPCPVIAVAPNAEETEKRLIGAALTGQAIISIDNCNGELRSPFLCQAVERPLLQVRALGSSDLARIGNSVTCFANGNNIEVAEDLVRRAIQCSLDADMEQPETRKFKGDPMKAVLADRGRYVSAILTVARAYIVAGKPGKPSPFASFDRWSELVRGALIWLGHTDPVRTVAQLHTVDPVGESRSAIFAEIAELTGATTGGVTTGEVVRAADDNEILAGALARIAGKDGTISPDRLGWWFRRNTNAFGGGYKLVRDDSTKTRRWILRP